MSTNIRSWARSNLTLLLGISVPILMILFVAAFIYLPGLFIHPQYDFLYTTSGDYYWNEQYYIRDGQLEKREVNRPSESVPATRPRFYIYNVANNTSTEVSYDEARQRAYSGNQKSPDDFEIVSGCEHGHADLLLFSSYSGNCGDKYISGHNVSNQLDIQKSSDTYDGNFHFIGWVI